MSYKRLSQKRSRFELLAEFASAPDTALFKQDTLCAIRDCSPATVERDRWVGGGIPYVKIGRSIRYRKSDILDFLDSKKVLYSTSCDVHSIGGGDE